ncbi:hypothetical protein D9615_010307 [Tricholomella constricta]|uniref:DUF659 domain-containing protein n=1 Tax=Tricholomella constricta TaxID=117010 RepID=A0A8H5GP40_9AGAR|nr:hypothetical protein D9615_010307 [Tricholomella constricta]
MTAERKKDREGDTKTRTKLLGSMQLVDPVKRVPAQRDRISIPTTYLLCIKNKLCPPLNFFTNEHIDAVNYAPQEIHFKLLRPWADEDTTEKVQLLDMPKMISLWGSDDASTCLSPFRFVEATGNLLAALELLCDPSPSVSATMGSVTPSSAVAPSVPSYASEYKKRRDFFLQLDNFEATYADWYPFELKARRDILKGVLFDWDAYASEVLLRVRLGELERERRPKRASEPNSAYPNKFSRQSAPTPPPLPVALASPFVWVRRESRSVLSAPEGTPTATIRRQPLLSKMANPSSHVSEITLLHATYAPTPSVSIQELRLFGPQRRTKAAPKRESAAFTTSTGSATTVTDPTPCMSALSAELSMPLLSAARLVTGPLMGSSKPDEVLCYRDFSDTIFYRPRSLTSLPSDDELFKHIVTPYDVSAYDHLLTKHNLHSNYPLLITNLTRGFPLGTLPKLTKSIIIKNHPSVDLHPEAVADYLSTEIALGRMSSPFTLSEVERILRGPIYCSPFIVAEQDTSPDSPPKLRVCRNLSKADPLTGTPSVNSHIAKEDFPTRFDMAFRVTDEVARAPPGTQAMSFDIKSFHRTCPALPDYKPFLIVSFKGDFYIDHVHPFGARPASSNSGQVANASIDIWHAETWPSCLFFKYEDDIEAVRYPVSTGPFHEGPYHYTHDRDSVMALVADLNIPWHPDKTDTHFSTNFTYIGFSWDLVLRRVSLPEKKRLKYLNRVALMLNAHLKNRAAFNLRDIQIIYGTLVHVTFVYPEGSSRLPVFSNFMSGYKSNTFVTHHLSDSVVALYAAHVGIYVDASSDGADKLDPLSLSSILYPPPPQMADTVWRHYHKGPKKYLTDKNHWEVRCRGCIRARVLITRNADLDNVASGNMASARTEAELEQYFIPRSGKIGEMWTHLSRCENVDALTRDEATCELYTRKRRRHEKENRAAPADHVETLQRSPDDVVQLSSPIAGSLRSDTLSVNASTPSPLSRTYSNTSISSSVDPLIFYGETLPHSRFSRSTQDEFNADLCRLLVVCNIAWWAVENPYWRGFFNKWLPNALLPGRKELSDRVLNEEADKVIREMLPQVKNGYGTGQCDGWKNIAKTSLIASTMNVEYKPYLLNVADISALHKTAENLLENILQEIKYATEILKIIVVAWCTDASAESAKMRRLLKARMPWIITLDCWCHQINLVVGDIFKVKGVFVKCIEGATEVVKWFNNHSRALGMLKEVQRQKLLKVLALILPVLTRWTSHYLTIRRLLDLEIVFKQLLLDSREIVLRCAGEKAKAKLEAEAVIGVLEGWDFWPNLKQHVVDLCHQIKAHLEPLAIAANVTQNESRGFDESISRAVLASLEKRWANADRPIFILAVVLNPYIRANFFSRESPYRSFAILWNLVAKAYQRLFDTSEEPNHAFRTAFGHYVHRTGEWSDEAMGLPYHKKAAVQEERVVNLITLWRELHPSLGDDSMGHPTGPPQGKSALVEIAMRIHSATPNSAATERIFSQFGVKHSKHRNRTHPEKIRKEVLLKTNTLSKFGPPPRRKRTFGDEDGDHFETDSDILAPSQPEASPSINLTDPLHFGTMAREMVAEASRDLTDMAAMMPPTLTPTPVTPTTTQPTNNDLTLKNLFHYPLASDTSSTSFKVLTECWQAGEMGFANERTFHDILYEEDDNLPEVSDL